MYTSWNASPEQAAAPAPVDSSQFVDARRAAGQASSQAGFLTAGTGELTNGLNTLNEKTGELKDGITELNAGAQQLNQGLVELQAGTGQLGDGAVKIADGVQHAIEQVQGLTMVQTQVIAAVDNIDSQLAKSTDPRAAGWRKQLADVRAEAAKLGINGDMVDRLDELRSGTRDLANQLAVPGYAYHDGIYEAAKGTKQLAAGTTQLEEGTGAAIDGINQLADGAAKVDQMAQKTRDDITAITRALPVAPASAGEQAAGNATPARVLAPMIAFFIAALVTVGGVSLFAIARPWTWGRTSRFGMTPTLVGIAAVAAVGIATLWATTTGLDSTGMALASLIALLGTITAASVGAATMNIFGPTLGRIALFLSLIIQMVVTGHVWTAAATSNITGWKHTLLQLMPVNYTVDALVTVGNNGAQQHLIIACGVLGATTLIAALIARFLRPPVDAYGFAEDNGIITDSHAALIHADADEDRIGGEHVGGNHEDDAAACRPDREHTPPGDNSPTGTEEEQTPKA